MQDRRPLRSTRAQSEVFGAVVLVGIVVLGAVVAGLVGGPAVADLQQDGEIRHAENELRALDERISGVGLGGVDATSRYSTAAGIGPSSTLRTDESSWIRVDRINETTGVPRTIVNSTMGTVVSVHDGTTVALEGGGIWRSDGSGVRMISPPELHFRNGTLTLPIIAVTGDRSLDGQLRIDRNGPTDRRFPNASAGLENRIETGDVEVTVHSQYYRAWGRYFDRTTGGLVTYDHAARTASVKFLTGSEFQSIRGGIIATAGAGRLEMEGSGAYTDSYDSRVGDYASTQTANGTIQAAGDVDMVGNSTVKGDLRSGGQVLFSGDPTVTGSIYWTEPPAPEPGDVDGEDGIHRIEGVPTIDPIDGHVFATVEAIEAHNNNSEAAVIQGDRISMEKGTTGELSSGRYYVETLGVHGGDLTLNTTDGDIDIAVRDWMQVDRQGGVGGSLEVAGNGTVRVYIASERETSVSVTGLGEQEVNLHVGKASTVEIPDERSTQFRILGPRNFNATIASDNSPSEVTYDGIIYAPAGQTGSGTIYIKHAELFGAYVTGTLTVGLGGAVHYDHGLESSALPRSPTVSRIEYMHVSIHRVTVSGS